VLIAATNRDLKTAVSKGAFRGDLFCRLNVFPIEMPSLRARSEDIALLIEYFIQRYAHKLGKKISSISKKTLDQSQSYSWAGNIRELQNVTTSWLRWALPPAAGFPVFLSW
jgi:formate hydrogenlyase transcriptional activator